MHEKLQGAILEKLYAKFFEDHITRFSTDGLIRQVSKGNDNDVKMALQELEWDGMVDRRDGTDWRITAPGIEQHEKSGYDDGRIEQRIKILDILNETYQRDVDEWVSHEVLVDRLNLKDLKDILSQMQFLEDCRQVEFDFFGGGSFDARLTVGGIRFLESLGSE